MLTTLEEKNFKEEIFGTVFISPQSGIFDSEAIKKPLPPGFVMRAFCKNCGLVYCLDDATAKNLFNFAKLPYAPQGNYFLLGACGRCGSAEYTTELKQIS